MSLCDIVFVLRHIELFLSSKSDTALRALAGFQAPRTEKTRTASGPPVLPDDLSTPTTEAEVCMTQLLIYNFIISNFEN